MPDLDPAEQPLVGDPKPGRLVDSQNGSPSAWLFAQGQGGGAAAEAGELESDNSPGPPKKTMVVFFPMGLFPIDPTFYPQNFKTFFCLKSPEDLQEICW